MSQKEKKTFEVFSNQCSFKDEENIYEINKGKSTIPKQEYPHRYTDGVRMTQLYRGEGVRISPYREPGSALCQRRVEEEKALEELYKHCHATTSRISQGLPRQSMQLPTPEQLHQSRQSLRLGEDHFSYDPSQFNNAPQSAASGLQLGEDFHTFDPSQFINESPRMSVAHPNTARTSKSPQSIPRRSAPQSLPRRSNSPQNELRKSVSPHSTPKKSAGSRRQSQQSISPPLVHKHRTSIRFGENTTQLFEYGKYENDLGPEICHCYNQTITCPQRSQSEQILCDSCIGLSAPLFNSSSLMANPSRVKMDTRFLVLTRTNHMNEENDHVSNDEDYHCNELDK